MSLLSSAPPWGGARSARSGGTLDARAGSGTGLQPLVADAMAASLAAPVAAVSKSCQRALELLQVALILVDEGRHLGPLEPDGRAFRSVLRVGTRERGPLQHT